MGSLQETLIFLLCRFVLIGTIHASRGETRPMNTQSQQREAVVQGRNLPSVLV
ncbi:MAG: hypothetical protein LBJ00_06575 [Planctomycetaceae bacterium]|nr:hypothetical protein [Planctomycetaceae bacterium]